MPLKNQADTKLIGGPYKPPRCKPGDTLFCEIHGEVVVHGFTDRTGWPTCKFPSRQPPIVCGELVRAIRTESRLAVAYWWQVSKKHVSYWRRSLGVERSTPGTKRLKIKGTFTRRDLKKSNRARKASASREKSRAVMARRWRKNTGCGGGSKWSRAEITALKKHRGKDIELAKKISRTIFAIRTKRAELTTKKNRQ